MRHGYRGFIDYDRNRLRTAPPSERLDWFEDRVLLVVINPLKDILESQVTARADSSALLIGGVSLLAAMEAAGRFVIGDKGDNFSRFEAFAKRMSSELHGGNLRGVSYPKVLWKHFRNGLAHGFAVCHGGFERGRGEAYMAVNVDGNLIRQSTALIR